MATPTYLLLAIGILGAADILLFHTIANGIRAHADSRQELLVHSLRGPTYASLFVLIPNFAMQGVFFWVLIAILIVDVGISLWDFAIEKRSRAVFGGLPTGEYVLHVVIGMLFGALVASILYEAAAWAEAPTRLAYEPAAVPDLLRAALAVMAGVVLWTELQDLRAAIRLGRSDSGATRAAIS
jgi:hypothetical protein